MLIFKTLRAFLSYYFDNFKWLFCNKSYDNWELWKFCLSAKSPFNAHSPSQPLQRRDSWGASGGARELLRENLNINLTILVWYCEKYNKNFYWYLLCQAFCATFFAILGYTMKIYSTLLLEILRAGSRWCNKSFLSCIANSLRFLFYIGSSLAEIGKK